MVAPLLHTFLGIGLTLTAAVLVFVRQRGIASPEGIPPMIAYALSAISVVLVAVAFFVLKPRVPTRPTGQPIEQYWSAPDAIGKVLLVWSLMEGAGIIAAVAYFLTAEPISAVTAALVIVAFWLVGPNSFANP